MQPLELLPSAPGSLNCAESTLSKSSNDPAVSGGDFGRLMEQAMSPDEKDESHAKPKNDTNLATNKGKVPAAMGKVPGGKVRGPVNPDTSDADTHPDPASTTSKAGAVTSLTAAKHPVRTEKDSTDTTTGSPAITDASEPPPVFLSLPLQGHPAVHVTDAKTADPLTGIPATQPVTATGAAPVAATPTNLTADGKLTPTSSALNTALTAGKTAADKTATDDLALNGTTKNLVEKTAADKLSPAEIFQALNGKVAPSATAASSQPQMPGAEANASQPPANLVGISADALKADQTPTPDANTDANTAQIESMATFSNAMANNGPKPLKNDGTGVATTALSMKKNENANKIAGLDVQLLPVGTNGAARETVLPSQAVVTAVRMTEKQNLDPNLPLSAVAPVLMDAPETSSALVLPSLADARMRDVERTHELVSLHALRMVESKSDSLSMVIRPGGGTELSLEMRHRNGVVEAEASLQHGDYQLLNQHWPDLQQRLEQRGIKLAPLGSETDFTGAGNGNFSQQQSTREESAQQASAFAEFTVAMNRGGATARLAPVSAGGWESWA